MTEVSLITEKITEVKNEMKRVGLWATTTPAWVLQYGKRNITTGEGFSEWLQFIYLPNRKTEMTWKKEEYTRDYIAPQATKFFGGDINKGKLLQLLIELDSLS
jgi:uncharacterized protein YqcC (DUF446 family)